MSKATITLLHYAAPPTIGGVESTIAMHARLFAGHGYPVSMIAGAGQAISPNVPLHILPDVGSRSPRVADVNAELAGGTVTDRFYRLASDLARELEPLVADSNVIAHNILSLHKNLALTRALGTLAARGVCRLIAWCHDFAWTDPHYADQMHSGLPWDLLRYPWQGVRYAVVSDARQRELQELWSVSRAEFAGGPVPAGEGHRTGERDAPDEWVPSPDQGAPAADWATAISIVPPGIDPLEFLGVTPNTSAWARRFGFLDADPLLLLPARLTRRKNVEYAIEIVAALHAAGRPAKLVVTGPPGPHNATNAAYLAQLESLRETRRLADDVIFLHQAGAVDAATLRDLYLLADAVLFPSEREGFGLPLLEAGLTRAPIFCSDIAPFRRVAGDRAVYLVPGNAERAAEQIVGTLEGDRAYQFKRHVVREYAWERIFTDRIEPMVRI